MKSNMITNDNLEWWEKFSDKSVRHVDHLNGHYFLHLLLQDCIKNKKILRNFRVDGFFEKESSYAKLVKEIEDLDYRLILETQSIYEDEGLFKVFISSLGVIQISIDADNEAAFSYYGSSLDEYEKFKKITKPLTKNKTRTDHIYVMINGESGNLRLHTLGAAAVPLLESNYNKGVLDKVQNAVEHLNSEAPQGRLVILDGPPGTGKSYLVRSLIKKCPNAVWIFIPSEMVASISGPALIPVLLREKEDGKPFILVVEDADECLIKRDRGNLSAISTLLNASSGMLGDMIDIRMVCTTNTPSEDLDAAVVRDCRLLERIEVNELSYEESVVAYKGIVKQDPPKGLLNNGEAYTLANLYALAKGKSNKTKTKVRKAGFI